MQPTSDQLAAEVGAAACHALIQAQERIKHCLDQLTDEQLWQRPTDSMNSIGNLILHLTGNVRQWIVAGIGAAPDVRQRPLEFSERGPIAKADLLHGLELAVTAACTALRNTTAQELLRPRIIQGFHVTGLGAIFDSVPHFKGHTQEIIHMTRSLLGNAYQFAWTPSTPEEGAAT